jgi:hypothetical protein
VFMRDERYLPHYLFTYINQFTINNSVNLLRI